MSCNNFILRLLQNFNLFAMRKCMCWYLLLFTLTEQCFSHLKEFINTRMAIKTILPILFLDLFSLFLDRNAKIISSKLKLCSFQSIRGANQKCRKLLEIWVYTCF